MRDLCRRTLPSPPQPFGLQTLPARRVPGCYVHSPIMQCPFCREIRYSKNWMPSQWKARNPEINDFHCCRVCDTKCIMPPRAAEEQVGLAIAELKRIVLSVTSVVRDGIGKFMEKWMSDLSYDNRKGLSHYGAICRRQARDPIGRRAIFDFTTTKHDRAFILDERSCFDPGNLVYTFAFRLLWDDVWQKYHWNAETTGDIIEGILGLHYQAVLQNRECVPARRLSRLLDDLTYNVWRVLWFHNDESLWRNGFPWFHDWIKVRIYNRH